MNARRLATTLAALGAFVLNPALLTGCDPEFSYGEAEMVGLMESVNQQKRFTFVHEGKSYELTIELAQKEGSDEVSALGTSVATVAHACSTRTFMRSASACIDETVMPLTAKITIRRAGAGEPIAASTSAEGNLNVRSVRLEQASVDVSLGEGSVTLESPDAKAFQVRHVSVPSAKLFYSAS